MIIEKRYLFIYTVLVYSHVNWSGVQVVQSTEDATTLRDSGKDYIERRKNRRRVYAPSIMLRVILFMF